MDEDEFASDNEWRLNRAMVTGRYSQGLVRELDAHVEGRSANVFVIVEEIRSLEGAPRAYPSRTKAATQFNGRWLNGLWHKHHMQPRFMARNIMQHWTVPRMEQLLAETMSGRDAFDDEAINVLTHGLVMEGYGSRGDAGALTGEGIVFARQDDVSYYLTLADHDEEDEGIWARCMACRTEFPELVILRENRLSSDSGEQ